MAYSEPVIPLDEMAKWKIPENIQMMQLNPPNLPFCPGHQKTRRITSKGEDAYKKTVIFHQCGHNNNTCKNPILANQH